MSMLTLLNHSRYTLKGWYNIGNVGKTASMSMLTLFESRYTRVSILIEGVLPTLPMLYLSLNIYEKIIKGNVHHLSMRAHPVW